MEMVHDGAAVASADEDVEPVKVFEVVEVVDSVAVGDEAAANSTLVKVETPESRKAAMKETRKEAKSNRLTVANQQKLEAFCKCGHEGRITRTHLFRHRAWFLILSNLVHVSLALLRF